MKTSAIWSEYLLARLIAIDKVSFYKSVVDVQRPVICRAGRALPGRCRPVRRRSGRCRPQRGGCGGSSRARRARRAAPRSPTCGRQRRASPPAAPIPRPAAECPRGAHPGIPRRRPHRSGRSAGHSPRGCGAHRRCAWKDPVPLPRSARRASAHGSRRPPRPDRSSRWTAPALPPPQTGRAGGFPRDYGSSGCAFFASSFWVCRCMRSACSRSCLPRT